MKNFSKLFAASALLLITGTGPGQLFTAENASKIEPHLPQIRPLRSGIEIAVLSVLGKL